MLKFSNPGEIDPIAMTTLGVNVKLGESPIGFFGTGLKYVIAASLRLDLKLEIQSGLRRFTFKSVETMIRNKPFGVIHLVEIGGSSYPLGFTTDLGKTWRPWMLYRELYCNALDEGGKVEQGLWGNRAPEAGQTNIYVSGLDEEHFNRKSFILESNSLWGAEAIEAHRGPGKAIFYRGIKVLDLGSPTRFAYNIKEQIQLTEDRTLANFWAVKSIVAQALLRDCPDMEALQDVLTQDQWSEHDADFDWSHIEPSEEFLNATAWAVRHHPSCVNASAVAVLNRARPRKAEYTEVQISKLEQAMLARALKFLEKIDHKVTAEIKIVDHLGERVAGRAKDGVIYIPKSTFGMGTKYLASTILEEHIHITLGLRDLTYDLQTWLFNKVITLGEELAGEPL